MIDWAVPEDAMEDAVRHVRQRVADANRKWEQVVTQRKQSAAKAGEVQRALTKQGWQNCRAAEAALLHRSHSGNLRRSDLCRTRTIFTAFKTSEVPH